VTARTARWELVGHDSDPVPAAEYEVDRIRDEMKGRADTAREVHDVLKGLAELDGWRGKAATAFGQRAEEALDNLGKVVDRYDAVAEALTDWAVDVGDARTATWSGVRDAEEAQDTIDANENTTAAPGQELTPEESSANQAREGAEDDLATARGAVERAMDDLEDAAGRAKDRIEDAADLWDDGMFSGLKNWIRQHADLIDFLVTVLEWAAIVIAAALIIAVVFFTAPVWLVGLAIGVAALTVVGVFALAFADTGKRDWGDVAMAVVDLALTLVGGKLASAAMKGISKLTAQVATRVGSEAGAATRAAWQARLASWPQFQNASRITNPANNLARWTQGVRGNMATAVQSADDAGRAGVEALENLPTTAMQRLLTQDSGLAGARNTLNALRGLGLQGSELAAANQALSQLRVSIGAVNVAGAKQIYGLGELIGNTGDLIDNPPWSSRP